MQLTLYYSPNEKKTSYFPSNYEENKKTFFRKLSILKCLGWNSNAIKSMKFSMILSGSETSNNFLNQFLMTPISRSENSNQNQKNRDRIISKSWPILEKKYH